MIVRKTACVDEVILKTPMGQQLVDFSRMTKEEADKARTILVDYWWRERTKNVYDT